MSLLDFNKFEKLYEANKAVDASLLNEGEFDKYARQIAQTNKEDIVALNPMLVEYQKIKKESMTKRIKITQDMNKETDAKKKETLNNDLVKANNDEQKKIELNAEKMADWAEERSAVLRYLMQSKLAEIDLQTMMEEFKLTDKGLSDVARKRMQDMIKQEKLAMKTRSEKMEKLIADENADTKAEDTKIEKAEKKKGDIEQDFDASGDVTAAEKKARQQRDEEEAESVLNQI